MTKTIVKKVYTSGDVVCDTTGRKKTYYHLMLNDRKIGAIKFLWSWAVSNNYYSICLCDSGLSENETHDVMNVICSFIGDNSKLKLGKFNIVNRRNYVPLHSNGQITYGFLDTFQINPFIAGNYVMIATEDDKFRIITTDQRDQLNSVGVKFRGISSYYIPYSCNGGSEMIETDPIVSDSNILSPTLLFVKNHDDFRNASVDSMNIEFIISTNDNGKPVVVPKFRNMGNDTKDRSNFPFSIEIIKNDSKFMKRFFLSGVFEHKKQDNMFGLDYAFEISNFYHGKAISHSYDINIPNHRYVETLKTIKADIPIMPYYAIMRFKSDNRVSSYPHSLKELLELIDNCEEKKEFNDIILDTA